MDEKGAGMNYPDPNKLGTPYWICSACAKEHGGVHFKMCSTGVSKTCGYCNGEKQEPDEIIYPTVDYRWPKVEE